MGLFRADHRELGVRETNLDTRRAIELCRGAHVSGHVRCRRWPSLLPRCRTAKRAVSSGFSSADCGGFAPPENASGTARHVTKRRCTPLPAALSGSGS